MAPLLGQVAIEINIETHIRKLVEKARGYASGRNKRAMIPGISHYLGAAIHLLKLLPGLEMREPGKGKFIEVREIENIISLISGATLNCRQARFRDARSNLDWAIEELKKLEGMELRLG